MALERLGQHLLCGLELALIDRVGNGVEHQRDAGERLNGPVVKEEREPAPLVLLGRDQTLGEPRALLTLRVILGH